MGIFSSYIETKIKIIRIIAERDEVDIEITRTLCDGGFALETPRLARKILSKGEEMILEGGI